MKIANADEMIKVYCRVTNLEPNMQYSGCLNIPSKTTLELVMQQDSKVDEIFGKKDKLINSPNVSKELFQSKPEVSKTTEKFVFDWIFKETDSFEDICNHLNLNLELNYCLISIRPSDLLSSKNGLILQSLRKAMTQGYTVKAGMAKINLGSSQSVFKGYRMLESYVEGFKLLVQTEYFSDQKTRDDAYVTTFVLVKDNRRSYLQFADISSLSKNTDMLAKILTDTEYNRSGNQQAGNHLIQILSKSICFGGTVHVFGHIQGISPYITSNRHTLYFIDHLYKNRGKSRNAYSELLLAEIVKLQKNNLKLKEKVQSSTQIYLTQDQLIKENPRLKNKRLETITECKDENTDYLEDLTEGSKCTRDCNEMISKIQDHNRELEQNVKDLKNELSNLKSLEIAKHNELSAFKTKNRELQDELLFIKHCNPETSAKLAEENSRLNEKLQKISEEIVKMTEKLVKVTEENSKLNEKLKNEGLRPKESNGQQVSVEIDSIHKHYYEIMTAEAHMHSAYEQLMNFRLEEMYDLYSSVIDCYNDDIKDSLLSDKQKFSELENEVKALNGKIMENSHEIQEKIKEIELKTNEIKSKNLEISAKNQEIEEKKQELEKIKQEKNEFAEQFKEEKSHELKKYFTAKLDKERKRLQKELDDKDNRIRSLDQKNVSLEQKLNDLKGEAADMKDKLKKCEEDLASSQIKYTELKENFSLVKQMAVAPAKRK